MQGSAHDPLRKIQAPAAPETKADIGTALKAARLKRGQSLDAVVSHTRIPKKFIEALEGNRLDEFPAMAYLRGFLKTYCDYLEVDFDGLWKLVSPPAPAEEKPGKPDAPRPSAHAPESGTPSSAVAVLGAAVLLAALLAFGLSRRSEDEAPKAPEAPTPVALQSVAEATRPHLIVEFREDAWLSVDADGKTLFEGRVPRNSRQEWTARKTLLLKTSAPESLRLTLNGNKYALPAPDPQGAYRIEVP